MCQFLLSNVFMDYAVSYEYLRHTIDNKCNYEAYMKSKERCLCGSINMLIRICYFYFNTV